MKNLSEMKLLILVTMLAVVAEAEVFTALVDLENVVYTESSMLDTLDHFIEEEQRTLDKIKEQAANLRKLNREAIDDPESFLAHPVNAFQTVKRFIWEWVEVESAIRQDAPKSAYLVNMSQYSNYFPGKEDLSGAAAALLRLQDTYKLKAKDIADGNIKGVLKFKPQMSVQDVFEVGRVAYNGQDQYHAQIWLKEALDRVMNMQEKEKSGEVDEVMDERKDQDVDIVTILDYLSYATYMEGDLKTALQYTNDLLELDPDHERAKSNKDFFDYHMIEAKKARGDSGDIPKDEEQVVQVETEEDVAPENYTERQMYEALCRGDVDVLKNLTSAKAIRNLKCSYQHYNKPLLFLQPAKEEVVFNDPKLIIFRDILEDYEMKHIKKTAIPKLKRATVRNLVTGNLEFADYRISKSAWLKEDTDEIVYRIRRRVEAYSGLDLLTAEELQVVNYGIGGHYEPHFDFARNKTAYANGIGNRIATMLFYMSNIEAGGGTVFPRVGARVLPHKGDAAFWFNLLRNGDGNHRTRHAGCPVLSGSKWVANIWIHELGQEFRHKCSLNADE